MEFTYIKTNINPNLPCHMEGYNDRIANNIHDNLYLNTFAFKGKHTCIFHVFDVIMIPKDFAERIKDEISSRFHIEREYIIISAIHTHSAPKISTKLFPDILPDENYLKALVQKAIKNTQDCLNSLIHGEVYFGSVQVNGFYSNRNDKDAYFNNQIDVLKFVDDNKNPVFSVCTIACHPTLMPQDSTEISADLFGYMREEFYRVNGYPLVICTAEAGDVSTRYTRKGHGTAEIERVGNALVQRISNIDHFERVSMEDFSLRMLTYSFRYDPKEDIYIQKSMQQLKDLIDGADNQDVKAAYLDMARSVASRFEKDEICVDCHASIMESKDLRMIIFPGEIFSELGRRLRAIDTKKTLIFGYCNDFKGYAIDDEHYGYSAETFLTDYPYLEADRFIDKIVEMAKNEIY